MNDNDLTFLSSASNEDLLMLCDILTKDKKGKRRWTEQLTSSENYKKYYPDRCDLIKDDIVNELQRYGGNTFLNVLRRHGVSYREILFKVCKRQKVNFNKKSDVVVIERNLLEKMFLDSLEGMGEEELQHVMDDLGIHPNLYGKQAMLSAIHIAIKQGGFKSYIYILRWVNAILRYLIGHGLSIAGNAWLTWFVRRFIASGWAAAFMAAWTAYDIAGPAFRVITPAVIQIAYMRAKLMTGTKEEETI